MARSAGEMWGKVSWGQIPPGKSRTGSVFREDHSVGGGRWIQERPAGDAWVWSRNRDRVTEGLTQSSGSVWALRRDGDLGC